MKLTQTEQRNETAPDIRNEVSAEQTEPGRRGHEAFSLLELIVLLSILSIFAGALAASFVRQLDQVAIDQEDRSLKSYAAAFKDAIRRNRYVPDASGWASQVASQLGLQTSAVATNTRGRQRVLLFDPTMILPGGSGPPYTQGLTNLTAPDNLRLILLSSISIALPSAPTNTTATFDTIWATADGTTPAGWSWSGAARDLRMQRLTLDDLFASVLLNVNDPTNLPSYYVDTLSTNLPMAQAPRILYVIRDTQIGLVNGLGTLEYTEVVQNPSTFMFDLGTWRQDAFVGRGVTQLTPVDLQRAANLFRVAAINPHAKFGATPTTVYNAMVSYMSNFVVWRTAGYPIQGSKPPAYIDDAYSALKSETVNLIATQ